jgi:hypothetical protein
MGDGGGVPELQCQRCMRLAPTAWWLSREKITFTLPKPLTGNDITCVFEYKVLDCRMARLISLEATIQQPVRGTHPWSISMDAADELSSTWTLPLNLRFCNPHVGSEYLVEVCATRWLTSQKCSRYTDVVTYVIIFN